MKRTGFTFIFSTHPKVTDFGLAKRLDTADGLTADRGGPRHAGVHGPGAGRRGAGQDRPPPADVYALGAILYERPDRPAAVPGGRRMTDIAHAGAGRATRSRPRRLNPGIPRDLETICLKCLEKDPAGGTPSAAALADDLRRFLDGRPVTARPVGRRPGLAVGEAEPDDRRPGRRAWPLVLVAGTVVSTTFAVRAHRWSAAAQAELEENKELRQHERETMRKLFLYLKDRPELLQAPTCDILDQVPGRERRRAALPGRPGRNGMAKEGTIRHKMRQMNKIGICSAGCFCDIRAVRARLCYRHSSIRLATSAVHPVWWLAPRPAPVSPWKYS